MKMIKLFMGVLSLLLVLIASPALVFSQVQDDDEFDEDEAEYYEGGRFKTANGIGGEIGLTTSSFVVGVQYMRFLNPDWIAQIALNFTSAKDPRESERVDRFTGQSFAYDTETNAPKLNSVILMPIKLGVQRRLFRGEINSSFRPFVEAGGGPTFGYLYSYNNGLFSGTSINVGANAYMGAGAYFGSNPMQLQGLSFRFEGNYFPNSIELLPGRLRNSFQGVSINLLFGTFF
jgi:hypothetical protein